MTRRRTALQLTDLAALQASLLRGLQRATRRPWSELPPNADLSTVIATLPADRGAIGPWLVFRGWSGGVWYVASTLHPRAPFLVAYAAEGADPDPEPAARPRCTNSTH